MCHGCYGNKTSTLLTTHAIAVQRSRFALLTLYRILPFYNSIILMSLSVLIMLVTVIRVVLFFIFPFKFIMKFCCTHGHTNQFFFFFF